MDSPVPEPRVLSLLPGRHVLDMWGDAWVVADSRSTKFDFTVYLGRPVVSSGPHGRTIIVTDQLASHFETHRRHPAGLMLPIGGTAIKRIRSLLGHHRYQDAGGWWLERTDDLARLTTADFCVRHKVSPAAVSRAHSALIGRKTRPAGWWKGDEVRTLLLSKAPTAIIAAKLGLAASSIRRMRSDVK